MPTYSRITIAVSPDEDKRIKAEAKAEGVSISSYCRDCILSNSQKQEQQDDDKIDRVPLEVRLDELTKKVQAMEEQNTQLYSVIAEYITRTDEQIYEQSHFVARFIEEFLIMDVGEEEAEIKLRNCEKEAKRDLERYKAAMMEGD